MPAIVKATSTNGESRMTRYVRRLVATIVFTAGIASVATVASAAPVTGALAVKNAVPANVESVQLWQAR